MVSWPSALILWLRHRRLCCRPEIVWVSFLYLLQEDSRDLRVEAPMESRVEEVVTAVATAPAETEARGSVLGAVGGEAETKALEEL